MKKINYKIIVWEAMEFFGSRYFFSGSFPHIIS